MWRLLYNTKKIEGYFKTAFSLFSNAAPRRFLPITFPLGSSKKLCGMLLMPNCCATAFPQPLRSLSCVQASISCCIAASQASRLESIETPSTVNPLDLYLLKAATTFGFSMRQGRHQLAQKSTSTYFPVSYTHLTLPTIA